MCKKDEMSRMLMATIEELLISLREDATRYSSVQYDLSTRKGVAQTMRSDVSCITTMLDTIEKL